MLNYPDEAIARQIGERVEKFVRNVIAPYERDPRLEDHGPCEELVKEIRDKARAAGVMTPHILDDGSPRSSMIAFLSRLCPERPARPFL